jgi:hypothetical protein
MQQSAAQSAGPDRDSPHVYSPKPFEDDCGMAEIGLPPTIEILADDRKLNQRGGYRDSALLQLADPSDEGVAALRNLMHDQYDGHHENQAGQEGEQQGRQRMRAAAEHVGREADVEGPGGDGDQRRPS